MASHFFSQMLKSSRGRTQKNTEKICVCLCLSVASLAAQAPTPQPPPNPQAAIERASERIRALQREADALASQEKTLLVELRKLEIERQIKAAELSRADAELKQTRMQLQATVARAAALSDAAENERPDVEARLVQLCNSDAPSTGGCCSTSATCNRGGARIARQRR
jgi:septal ring factor EnvC (AmiA/AmiB activator)